VQLTLTHPTAIKVAYASQDQRTTTEQTFTPVRNPPPPRVFVPQANYADICFSCNTPGHSATHCAEPYRPRERHQPPIGVHALADSNVEEDKIEHPADAVKDSKYAEAGCPT